MFLDSLALLMNHNLSSYFGIAADLCQHNAVSFSNTAVQCDVTFPIWDHFCETCSHLKKKKKEEENSKKPS